MSTTPQTDAAAELARPVGHDSMPRIREYVPVEFARQLERENAALRKELEAQAVLNGKGSEREAKLLAEVAALRKQLEQWNQSTEWFAKWAEKKQELERENAALRKDKERLDWLERRTVSRLQSVLDHVELHKLPIREAIDLSIEEIGQ